jgi:hypothetical protein
MSTRSPCRWCLAIRRLATSSTTFFVLSVSNVFAQGEPARSSQIPIYLWFIGAGVLGLAIACGFIRNRAITRAEQQSTKQPTKDSYRADDRHRPF